MSPQDGNQLLRLARHSFLVGNQGRIETIERRRLHHRPLARRELRHLVGLVGSLLCQRCLPGTPPEQPATGQKEDHRERQPEPFTESRLHRGGPLWYREGSHPQPLGRLALRRGSDQGLHQVRQGAVQGLALTALRLSWSLGFGCGRVEGPLCCLDGPPGDPLLRMAPGAPLSRADAGP